MGWSWQVPTQFQIKKYEPDNMIRYLKYLKWVGQQPWDKLKFLNEAHVVSRELHKKKVLGLVGQRTWLQANTLQEASASVTILTALEPSEPVVMLWRTESNTQWDFLNFVIYCLQIKALRRGDFLIVDNAAVHGGSASYPILDMVLTAFGVKLVFLPAYSPELNPCELVFNVVKCAIRNHQRFGVSVFVETIQAVSQITYRQMVMFYRHCIFPKVVLPDLQ